MCIECWLGKDYEHVPFVEIGIGAAGVLLLGLVGYAAVKNGSKPKAPETKFFRDPKPTREIRLDAVQLDAVRTTATEDVQAALQQFKSGLRAIDDATGPGMRTLVRRQLSHQDFGGAAHEMGAAASYLGAAKQDLGKSKKLLERASKKSAKAAEVDQEAKTMRRPRPKKR